MKVTNLVVVLVAALVMLGGCSGIPSDLSPAERTSALAAGYGSLGSLLKDERSVDGILKIKSVDAEAETLIKAIAASAGTAYDALESLQDAKPRMRLDGPEDLPIVEKAARESIATKTALDLVFSDDTFEVRLLMSQGQALRYGRYMADKIGELDENEDRRKILDTLEEQFKAHYVRVVELLAGGDKGED